MPVTLKRSDVSGGRDGLAFAHHAARRVVGDSRAWWTEALQMLALTPLGLASRARRRNLSFAFPSRRPFNVSKESNCGAAPRAAATSHAA